MYDTWGSIVLLCETYLVICNLQKTSQNGSGLKELRGTQTGRDDVQLLILCGRVKGQT